MLAKQATYKAMFFSPIKLINTNFSSSASPSPMPGRRMQDAEQYRYAFQGQEKDEETGKEAFELRLWDSRIGRWLTTDPYNEFHSPYLGMGNNPVGLIDPDGGRTNNPIYGSPPLALACS